MVILVAVGVERSNHPALADVTSAHLDVARVYGAIQAAGGDEFDAARSVCLHDPAADDLHHALNAIASGLCAADHLIIYFTGHCESGAAGPQLVCGDAAAPGRGRLHLSSLEPVQSSTGALITLILDCCYSGAALPIARRRDLLQPARFGVLASASPYRASYFDETGSAFTRALCRAIDGLVEDGENVTLARIDERIRTDAAYEGECLLATPEGLGDVRVFHSLSLTTPDDLPGRFVERLAGASVATQEMQWFGLAALPASAQLCVLDSYFQLRPHGEASWLIRRAIGSVVGQSPARSVRRRRLLLDLIASDSWMASATGVVGARMQLADEEIRSAVRTILADDNVIDLTWLAHLYLADRPTESLDLVLRSKLVRSAWGVLDIWDRYQSDLDHTELAGRLRDAGADDDALESLAMHLALQGIPAPDLPEVDVSHPLTSNTLARRLYRLSRRGAVPNPSAKWLLSFLYGSWRDHVESPASLLDSLTPAELRSTVWLMAGLPKVEHRMAVLAYRPDPQAADAYFDGLAWALEDPHPWVRRAAISAYAGRPIVTRALEPLPDRVNYPGILDMVIEAASIGIVTPTFLTGLTLTAVELEALRAVGIA